MKISHLTVFAVAAALSACATTQQPQTQSALQQQLDQAQTQNQQLQSQNAQLQNQVEQAQQQAATAQQPQPQATPSVGGSISLVPPNAKPGECFARVTTPAVYKTGTSKVLKSAASSRVVTTPPKYEWTTQRIMVSPQSTALVAVPATYKTVSKRVMVSPAHSKWVPGHGANERVNANGDVMCLVEVPAKYKTIKVREVATPATTRKKTTPARYKTIKVKKLVTAAGQKTIHIPAKYQTVSHTKKVRDSKIVWSRVVCHENANKPLITAVQRALKKNSYNPGPIDGLLGPLTFGAANRYEKAHHLATSNAGVITYDTLDALGVKRP